MADKTISQLPSGVPPQANDEYIVARGAANYKLTLGNILGAPTPIGSVTPNTATFTTVTATTGNITSVNATTVDATNVEVTNVKAKDGTAAITIADSTGAVTVGAGATFSGGNLDFSGTGQRITGDTSNATFGNRLAVQNSVTNGITQIPLLPNGTATTAGILPFNNSDTTNAAFFLVAARSTDATLLSGITGTGTYLPMTFYTGGSERVRIDTSGNVIVNTAAIATTATDGFLYVPTCAGAPTGTPTSYAGRAPIVVDTTNNKLYFYSNGTWRDAGP